MTSRRELVFVKLGGSVITDKKQAMTVRPEIIRQLAESIALARRQNPALQVLLGHGSGSFGHVVGHKYQIHLGIANDGDWQGYAETGAAAAQLNRIVTDALLEAGVPVVSIQPSAAVHLREGKLVAWDTWAIEQALTRKLVPLVHGDVAFDEIQGCAIASTEAEFEFLAQKLHPDRMVMVGTVDGVYDLDPLANHDTKRFERITPHMLKQIEAQLGGSHGVDVTGGMLTKVHTMIDLVQRGDTQRVHVISGLEADTLYHVLIDPDYRAGTIITDSNGGCS